MPFGLRGHLKIGFACPGYAAFRHRPNNLPKPCEACSWDRVAVRVGSYACTRRIRYGCLDVAVRVIEAQRARVYIR